MELATNLMSGLRKRFGAGDNAEQNDSIDWFALQTRLAAGHSARRALSFASQPVRIERGAFASWAAVPAGPEWGAPVINPNDLADCKGAAGKDGVVAEHVARGDRG